MKLMKSMHEITYTLTMQKLPEGYILKAHSSKDEQLPTRLFHSWDEVATAFSSLVEARELERLRSELENQNYGINIFQSREQVTSDFVEKLGLR